MQQILNYQTQIYQHFAYSGTLSRY